MPQCCACCGKPFAPRPQVPDQAYCSESDCQRARKRRWQRAKRQSDVFYRDNQRAAQQAWSERNPDYWREYRRRNPDYAQQNRERQRTRLQEERAHPPPPSQEAEVADLLESGLYRLKVLAVDRVAKMDVCFLVELAPVRGKKDV